VVEGAYCRQSAIEARRPVIQPLAHRREANVVAFPQRPEAMQERTLIEQRSIRSQA
jgi:hypothetical protein